MSNALAPRINPPHTDRMHFLSAEALRNLDQLQIAAGTPGVELMGRAARALAREILFLLGPERPPVCICAGPGNNGGDGFGLALHLHRARIPVEIRVAAPRERFRGDALTFLRAAEDAGVPLHFLPNPRSWLPPDPFSPPYRILIDALLGTGSSSAPRDTLAAAVAWFLDPARHAYRIAVDLPSGMDPDTGRPFDPSLCVAADLTLTLGAPKAGFLDDRSLPWTGSIQVLELGLPLSDIASASSSPWTTLSLDEAAALLPHRPPDAHKGRFGHVLVLGGAPSMPGAPVLSARAALRAGAGLATLFAPPSLLAATTPFPELLLHPAASGSHGTLCPQPLDFSRANAIALGPGLGLDNDTRAFTRQVLVDCPLPLVLDASALRALASQPDAWRHAACPRVLTPHPGEMAALLGLSTAEVQADRPSALEAALHLSGSAVLLKGARTRIALPTGLRFLTLCGNAGMATAGSGDVLTGILAALLAQRLPLEHATPLAAWLHARAGDLAAFRLGPTSLQASDLLDTLPLVLRHLAARQPNPPLPFPPPFC